MRTFSLWALLLVAACSKPKPPREPPRAQPDLPAGYCTQIEYKNCPPR
ncbi:MAG TPA: hypothetical protein VK540_35575 [Polyangiaceae bacterium]|nr:hypothetical protein [Polyangiaceae bacterium]